MRRNNEFLIKRAKEMRKLCLQMTYDSGAEGGHVGPALSIMDIMAVLYFDIMQYDSKNPQWEQRDRFILSKGHAVLGLYPALAFAHFISFEELKTFEMDDTRLAGHPCARGVPGVECPAGSLGHGLSIGAGIALGGRMKGRDYKTYVLIGDGESEEGSIWEAAMFAKQKRLGNLTAIVDANRFQYGGLTADIIDLSPVEEKWRAFGWNVICVDGHDIPALCAALDKKNLKPETPTCVIANTIKGKGVPFIEGNNAWHHARMTKDDLDRALAELGGKTVC